MKSFNRHFSRLAIVPFIVLITLVTSCKDDELTGPESALGKQLNLVVDQVTSSVAYSILVSADGSKVFTTSTPTGGYYYSSDGGTTFKTADNYYLRLAKSVDNLGNVLTSDKYLINGSTLALNTVNSYDELILGDNGKIFSYNAFGNVISQKDVSSGEFAPITNPAVPAPGTSVHVMKAPGIGLLYLETGANETAKAYFLDESTLQWSSSVSFSYSHADLNEGCNNLNAFIKFSYAGNNTILVKGCSGVGLVDLQTSDVTNIMYAVSDNEHLIYEDVRDGQVYVDDEKQVYVLAGTYEDLTRKFVYRYDGSEWSKLEGYHPLSSQLAVFSADQAGNIYYNASDGAGESVRGAVKVKVSTNEKTALGLPLEKLHIQDAAALSNNILLLIVDGDLYECDITAGTTVRKPVSGVNHVNVLSDGRLLVGGNDKIYISSDDGETWVETDKVFTSVDPEKSYAVSESRIVNGKIMLIGTYSYFYNNLSTGVMQNKYDNIAVEFDGSKSTKLPYTFPGDFLPAAIGNDGVIYGSSIMYFDWQQLSNPYELKANVAPEALKEFSGVAGAVTESGLQLALLPMQSGAMEVKSRGSSTEEWQSTNTPLPSGLFGDLELRLSGDRIVVINDLTVYLSGN